MKVLVLGGTGWSGRRKLLGHPPRRFEDYAREMAAAWKASA